MFCTYDIGDMSAFCGHQSTAICGQISPDCSCDADIMSNVSVTTALKALREEAKVGLREMARRLAVPPSTYSHYEDPSRFKDDYLPMSWAIRFADALEPNGMLRARVIALAGFSPDAPIQGLDERISRLRPRQREAMLLLLADLEAAQAAEESAGTVNDVQG